MYRVQVSLLLVLAAALVQAAPPVVTVPAEVKGEVGAFVAVRATVTESKVVKFVPLDAGLNLFPADLLADKTATVVTSGKAGRYRVLCYSGNADGPSEATTVTVVIGDPPPVDPVKPDPKPQPTAAKVCVVVVEESSLRTPAQADAMYDPTLQKWLKDGGHKFAVVDKDDPQSAAAGYAAHVQTTGLPTVIVIDATTTAAKKPLSVFRLPATAAELKAKIQEVVK